MSKFSPTEAISFGWDLFKKNVPFMLGIAGILVVMQLIFYVLAKMIVPTPPSLNNYSTTMDYSNLGSYFAGSSLLSFVFDVISFLVTLGIVKAIINLVDSGKGNLNDVLLPFKHPKILFNYILAGIVLFVALVVALIPITIVGILTIGIGFLIGIPLLIWVGIRIGFFIYFIIDKEAGPIESLKQSWAATKGNVVNLILFYLLSTGVIVLGAIALVVGLLVAIPVVMVAQAYVYRRLASSNAAPATTPTEAPMAPPPAEPLPST